MSTELDIEDSDLNDWQVFMAGKPVAEPIAASLPASRAMTLSIDFDRTFAADPKLWG